MVAITWFDELTSPDVIGNLVSINGKTSVQFGNTITNRKLNG
jgi:hypothetical protein